MFRYNNFVILVISFLLTLSISAQEKEDWKEKVKDLKGDITKIVIQTNDGVVTLTGKDAEEAFGKLKNQSFVFYSDDEMVHVDGKDHSAIWHVVKENGDNVFTIKESDGKNLIWITEEIDGEEGEEKEVEVKIENDEKKVTITTTKDGEEKVEILEGKEAEEYLEKHNKKSGAFSYFSPGHKVIKKLNKHGKNIWLQKAKEDDEGIEKKVKVEIIDGKKKVTVTTINEGEEKIEVFEGDDAEEYLDENMDHRFDFDDEDGNVIIMRAPDHSKQKHLWVTAEGDTDKCIEKKVNVEIVDGKKVVTITTSEDGEETVIELDGEEAEKFIESEDGDFHVIVISDGDSDKEMLIKTIKSNILVDGDKGKKIKVYVTEDDDKKKLKEIKIKKVKKEDKEEGDKD